MIQERFPSPSADLIGKQIRILDTVGAYWLQKGKIYKILGTQGEWGLLLEGAPIYWACQNNPIHRYFELINTEKEMKNEMPKGFAIEGKPHHIKAIWEDLREMGYYNALYLREGTPHTWERINHNSPNPLSKDKYRELYISTSTHKGDNHSDNLFVLPQDYNRALEYAKEAINYKWEEVIEFGGYAADFTTPGLVCFGCTSFSKSQVQAIRRNFKDITIEKLDTILSNL